MSTYAAWRPRAGAVPRRLLAQIAGGLLVATVAGGLSSYITDQGALVGLAAVLAFATPIWLVSTRRTQLALALFMVYIGALDGYLKLASGSGYVTLLRDVLLFSIVIGLLVRAQVRGTRLTAPPLTRWVAGFVVLVLVQLFNPQGGTLTHSLAGVRQQLEFVPLFFLTFAFVRTTKALRVFVVLLLLIATANGVVSWVQFNLKPDQFAAWGPGYSERVLGKGYFAAAGRTFADATGQGRTRPFGLGSDSGSGGVVGAFALGGIFALASLARRLRYLLFAVAMAIGALTAVITSQGRGVVVCSVVIVLAYALLTMTSRGRARGLLGLAVAGIVGLLVIQSIVGSVGSSTLRYGGLSASRIVQTTATARPGTTAAIATAITSYPLGAGLATAGPASATPGGTELTYVANAESEFSFLTLETGIAGMVLLVGFTVMLLVLGFRRLRHEPDHEARLLLAAIIAPLAGVLALYYPSACTASVPIAPYLWAIAGIVAYWLVARPAERARQRRQRSTRATNRVRRVSGRDADRLTARRSAPRTPRDR
jgi:hypothetical protein